MLATRISVQPLRDGQLPLDPFGDQALGKAQAPHLSQPLAQGADRPQLAGEPHLPDGGQVVLGTGLSRKLEARASTAARSAAGSSKVRAADDVQIGVAAR